MKPSRNGLVYDRPYGTGNSQSERVLCLPYPLAEHIASITICRFPVQLLLSSDVISLFRTDELVI